MTTTPPPAAAPVPGRAAPAASLSVEYPVFFVPQVAQAQLANAKRNRTWRIVSLVISLVIVGGIYWFLRDQIAGISWPLLIISLAVPVAFLGWAIVQEVRARRAVRTIVDGLALGVGRGGLVLPGASWAWAELVRAEARSGRFGRGDRLEFEGPGGQVETLPLAYLSMKPATIDSGVRALSGGRWRIDFSRLDA